MPVLFQDDDSNYVDNDILESADDSIESVVMEFTKPIAGGTLFITIGGSGTFTIQVKMGDGLSNYGPYHSIADQDGGTTHAVASYNLDMAIQEFWTQGVKQLRFKINRSTGSGDVPITGAAFNHVF